MSSSERVYSGILANIRGKFNGRLAGGILSAGVPLLISSFIFGSSAKQSMVISRQLWDSFSPVGVSVPNTIMQVPQDALSCSMCIAATCLSNKSTVSTSSGHKWQTTGQVRGFSPNSVFSGTHFLGRMCRVNKVLFLWIISLKRKEACSFARQTSQILWGSSSFGSACK